MKSLLVLMLIACGCVAVAEQEYQDPPANGEEPLAKQFSALAAARALDSSMLLWQQENRCIQCHANMHYGIARPLLAGYLPQPPEYDALLLELVEHRWAEKGLRYPMEPVVVSMSLVGQDRATGILRPITARALERMLSTQGPDGSWKWNPGAPKAFIREYEGTLLAALNLLTAPGEFRDTAPAQRALQNVREYISKHPPPSAYGEAMLLWASSHMESLADKPSRETIAVRLLALRGPDGGWSLENLIVGTPSFENLQKDLQRASDAYATGFVVYVLREAGLSAQDVRLQPAIHWLKTHQRQSGRWFVPSLSKRPNHLLSNSGTAWTVLALAVCGELPSAPKAATTPP